MADDLVVREWTYVYPTSLTDTEEHNALVRAYLAVVAERDDLKLDHHVLKEDFRKAEAHALKRPPT